MILFSNRSLVINTFEWSEDSKIILMSFRMFNPNPNQILLYFSAFYTNLIFWIQNILNPVKVVDNSSINSLTPNCSTLLTPWNNSKEFPVLLPRQSAHEWASWVTLQSFRTNFNRTTCLSLYLLIHFKIHVYMLKPYATCISSTILRISCTDHEFLVKTAPYLGIGIQQVITHTLVY